jgi:hypothetical protein
MIHHSFRPSERRQAPRLAIDHRSNLRLTLDGAPAESEIIQGVTITDMSQGGLMAAGAGQLVPGAAIMLEVPLVGWREAEVMWIAENRAGCRFVEPLALDELALAATHSERLAAECPDLVAQIANLAAGTGDTLNEETAGGLQATAAFSRRRRWPVALTIVGLGLMSFLLTAALLGLW